MIGPVVRSAAPDRTGPDPTAPTAEPTGATSAIDDRGGRLRSEAAAPAVTTGQAPAATTAGAPAMAAEPGTVTSQERCAIDEHGGSAGDER